MTAAYPWRPERVRVGTIGKAHGLDGSFRVVDACGWWEFPEASSVLVNGEPRMVELCRGDEQAPLIRLAGAEDRTACEALRGAALELRRDQLPEPDDDFYFRFDMVGCVVEHADGTPLGTIDAVEDGVAHDQLVVGEHRVPFVAVIVPTVDIPGRRMVLAEGWEPVPVE
jgi:16S rRNA processing protein RimM